MILTHHHLLNGLGEPSLFGFGLYIACLVRSFLVSPRHRSYATIGLACVFLVGRFFIMLEPSSSEDENETTTTVPELEDNSSCISGVSSLRDSGGRLSQNANLNAYHNNNLNVSQRSVTPCVEPVQPLSAQHHNQLNCSNSDKFLPVKPSLCQMRASSPNPPELSYETKNIKPPDEATESDSSYAEKEEAERKLKLQLYVFILRCVAYPFNARQQTDLFRRPVKITLSQLEQIISRFQSFLRGELQMQTDEPFNNAINNYFEAFLKSNRLHMIVSSGACSSHDFREVFRQNVEKRVKSLPEVEGMTKESIMSQWLTKFDTIFRGFDEVETKKLTGTKMQQYQQQQQAMLASETILSKEQLYDMFQNILKIKRFEHQLLYNALQVSIDTKLNRIDMIHFSWIRRTNKRQPSEENSMAEFRNAMKWKGYVRFLNVNNSNPCYLSLTAESKAHAQICSKRNGVSVFGRSSIVDKPIDVQS